MRKYLYLVTEHEQEGRVGGCKIMDQRMTRPEKNEEGPIQKFDRDSEDFYTVGKMVGMGYADFDSEKEYEGKIGHVIQQKLHEIDQKWLNKAGVEPEI